MSSERTGLVLCSVCHRQEYGFIHRPCQQAVGNDCTVRHRDLCPAAPDATGIDHSLPVEVESMNGDNNGRVRTTAWLAVLSLLVALVFAELVRVEISVGKLADAQQASTAVVARTMSELASRVSAVEVKESQDRADLNRHVDRDEVPGPGIRR